METDPRLIMLKRLFDICISFIGLLSLFPVILVISVLIRLSSGAPVFFRQGRIGKEGKLFTLLKFRTMFPITDTEKGEFEPGNYRRVTYFGRFLRKTKMDELPQLVNVIKGDMSIVGPRPEVAKWVAVYPERWKIVHLVKPGITDPASIVYRNEEKILATAHEPEKVYRYEILPKKLTIYEKYICSNNIVSDIGIIIKTIFAVIKS